jgi:hypothetical protein
MPFDIILMAAAGGKEADEITDRQLHAAMAAAPYVHPRLAAVAVQPVVSAEVEEERRRVRESLLRELADLAKPEPLLIEPGKSPV